MPNGSKRRGRGALGFDALEDRCLLSQSAGSMPSPWGPSGAPCAAGMPPSAMVSHLPQNSVGGRPGDAPSFQRDSSSPALAPPVAEQAPAPAAAHNSPAQPAAASSGSAAPALAVPAARSVLPLVGLTAFRPTRPAPNPPPPIILTSANGSTDATPAPTEVSDDQLGGTQNGALSSLAQALTVSLSMVSLTIPSAISWAIPTGSVPPVFPSVSGPAAVSEGAPWADRSPAIATGRLPAPQGADLIANLATLQHGRIDECLTWLFGERAQPPTHQIHVIPYYVQLAIAVLALELARRWRQRSGKTQKRTRRPGQFGINNLL